MVLYASTLMVGGDAKLVMKASAGDNTPLLHRAWLPADDDGAAKTLR